MAFIQIIEYKTSRIDELNSALDDWLEATKGKRASTRGVQTRDRDATNTYVQIVEFPSYDDAMANSNLPETGEFAAKLASLCDGAPSFRNLDVLAKSRCSPSVGGVPGTDVADLEAYDPALPARRSSNITGRILAEPAG